MRDAIADAGNAVSGAPLSRSGMVGTRLGPMIFSTYTIHRNDGTGNSPGSLLFGRLIDDDTVSDVRQLVKIPFTVTPINAQRADELRQQTLARQVRNPDNTFDWYLPDIHGEPLLQLELQLGPSEMNAFLIDNPAILAFILTTLSWFVVVGYLHWSVIRPMLGIKKHLFQIRSSGNYYYRLDSARDDEVGDLSQECDLLIDHIEQQNKLLDRHARELKKLSLEDGLTGLSNRRHLDELLTNYWSLHERDQQPLSFILCDIDYFKDYNDNFGHQAGDKVLQQLATLMENTLARKTDKAARYGGEEFAILLPNTDPLGVVAVARRLQKRLAELAIPHPYSKIGSTLTISIGCTTLIPDSKTGPQDLVRQADMAMYRAKSLGRNQIVIFDPDSSY